MYVRSKCFASGVNRCVITGRFIVVSKTDYKRTRMKGSGVQFVDSRRCSFSPHPSSNRLKRHGASVHVCVPRILFSLLALVMPQSLSYSGPLGASRGQPSASPRARCALLRGKCWVRNSGRRRICFAALKVKHVSDYHC